MQKAVLLVLAFVCLALAQQGFTPCSDCSNPCTTSEVCALAEGSTTGCSCTSVARICPNCAPSQACQNPTCSATTSAASNSFSCSVSCPCTVAECQAAKPVDQSLICPGTNNPKYLCTGDKLTQSPCNWRDQCPVVDCSANCPAGTCPDGNPRYSCTPDNNGGCTRNDKCPAPDCTAAGACGSFTPGTCGASGTSGSPKLTCELDRVKNTCYLFDHCPDCSANCPTEKCADGTARYTCAPNDNGGCSTTDNQCGSNGTTGQTGTSGSTIDCSANCPTEKCADGKPRYTCTPDNKGGCTRTENPCGTTATQTSGTQTTGSQSSSTGSTIDCSTTCPTEKCADGRPRFTCTPDNRGGCTKTENPCDPTQTSGTQTSGTQTSGTTTGSTVDCSTNCPTEKCADGKPRYTCTPDNKGGCTRTENQCVSPCVSDCPTDKCPNGRNKYTCGLTSTGSCSKTDNCPTTTEGCRDSCGVLPADVCPNGGIRYTCVPQDTTANSPCVKRDNCPSNTVCSATDCTAASGQVDLTLTCGPAGTTQSTPRYTCVGNVATATSPSTCKWRDNCPPVQYCTESDCSAASLPAGATTSDICPGTNSQKRFVCTGTVGFCSWRDLCPTVVTVPTCQITADASGNKVCGGVVVPTCPADTQLTELACVATSTATNAQNCAWKYYCAPYCTDSRCGTKPNCTGTVCRPTSVATGSGCAWYPASCDATPCRECPTQPCANGEIKTAGICVVSSVSNICAWDDSLKCEPVKCECTSSNTFPRCSVGEIPDTTASPICVPGSAICTFPCVRDKCYSNDVCLTDFASGCVYFKSSAINQGTTAANAANLASQLDVRKSTYEIIKQRPSNCPDSTNPATTPIDKLRESTNDQSSVSTANQELNNRLDETKDTIFASGSALLKDFTVFVLAIISNNDNKAPSIKVNIELIAVVPGTPVTSAHLDAYCKLLVESVFPKITKYTTSELVNCRMTRLDSTSSKRQATSPSANIYQAEADPTTGGVDRLYGSSSSATTYVASFFAVICLFVVFFM